VISKHPADLCPSVDAAIRLQSVLTQKTSSTQTNLAQKGVTYNQGRLSVVTDRAAPSREEYIASTQRAFEKGAKTMALHPDAFKTGPKNAEGNVEVLSSSGVDSP
jgi:hypothetical protein